MSGEPIPVDVTFDHPFRLDAGKILQSGRTHSLILSGNVQDLFYLPPTEGSDKAHPYGRYINLNDYLCGRWEPKAPNTILVVYELNGPIRFVNPAHRDRLKNIWPQAETFSEDTESGIQAILQRGMAGLTGKSVKQTPVHPFDDHMSRAIGRPAVALQLLRKFCDLSRNAQMGSPLYGKKLLIIVEWAHMIIPDGEVSRLNEADRHRVMILQDWFSDPGFMHGEDSVILLTESASRLNQEIVRMPQVLQVEVPAPDEATRRHFVQWYMATHEGKVKLWAGVDELVILTAGLNLQALHQLLMEAVHEETTLDPKDVFKCVEAYIISQLGEGVVEYSKPHHKMTDLIGYTQLKTFLATKVIPRVRKTGKGTLSGMIVCGPIGAGKTFIFEAVAAEIGIPVLVLKQIRSKWFGETDAMLERLYRILISLSKVMIFVDEADTAFGGVGAESHETERRLTGKIQGWMSDPRLKGKVTWLLMTARVHLLSPDIRRPGRGGSLIIPILDPEGDDRDAFIEWMVEPVLKRIPKRDTEQFQKLRDATHGYSSGAYGTLRDELIAEADDGTLTLTEVLDRVHDQLQPDIGPTRLYQTLHALLNTSRRSLHLNPKFTTTDRESWEQKIRELEARGIR